MESSGFEPRYDPQTTEAAIYKKWESSGFFNPDECVAKGIAAPNAEPFSIVLPPPNVTGILHMGHAAMLVMEDIMVRRARMQGKKTLWIPGTDHAAIATQAKVEKEILKQEKKTRRDLGREEFLKRVEVFAKESHDTIISQVKRLGASLDWSREAYTLDKERERAVRTAFKTMYDLGLIERKSRVVNWDPKGQTTISDDEIVYEERKAKLYTFKYDNGFPLAISTTRPETKFGDVAVAVHPNDARYKQFVGKTYDADFCGTKLSITVIADDSVDMEFGTGALGVTPAHSMIDWEIADRHHLPLKQVIDEYAKIHVEGRANGMKTTEARDWVIEELRKKNLIEKEEEVTQNVATAERTGGIIEPLPKLQWFVMVDKPFKQGVFKKTTLKKLMREAVVSGNISIAPDRFEKIYFHWIDNLRDWCISRQIWFGHRIPVWYKVKFTLPAKDSELMTPKMSHATFGTLTVQNEAMEMHIGEKPEGEGWTQDPDTLDTWFSSGLWPFSTLGWPNETQDLKTYFPNSVLETGYDILFFWVARMILMSTCLTGKVPFKKVYLHGLVRDAEGRKMSKSLGNTIDPLLMADQYGADATRMSLVIGASAGNDLKLSEDRIRGYRNFSTKIWNIARFIAINKPSVINASGTKNENHEKYLAEFAVLKSDVETDFDTFDFHLAGEKIYHYIWHTFADKIIEEEKETFRNGAAEAKAESYAALENLLLGSIKLLHPFMPFVTEAVWQKFRPDEMLMVARW